MPSVEPTLAAEDRAGGQVRRAALASVASRVPEQVVPSARIAERLGVSEDWILARTGVRERRIVAGERLDELATDAGRLALERAQLDPAALDLVVVATVAADDLLPNAAPLVAEALGAHGAGAFDLGAACTGFLSGLAVVAAQVESGRIDHALVIGAEALSRLTDRDDRSTAALFADGAGAAVVGPAANGGQIGPIVLGADGKGGNAIRASHDERLIHMRGHDTFRDAVRRLAEGTLAAAERSEVTLDEIDLFVYHQANARILAAVAERLDLPRERVIDCIDRYGNTSSATIPIALAEAQSEGRLEPGATVMLAAFGAGFTWGAGVVRWA